MTLAPEHPQLLATTTIRSGPVAVDGKFFTAGGLPFPVRGVTYGTFQPRYDEARFPDPGRIGTDLAAMAESGFTVVRTYTEPTADLLDAAGDHGLKVLAGVFFPDWRYLLGASRRDSRRVALAARDEVRETARRLAGDDRVFAICLGNEIPADVIRWYGTDAIARVIDDLADAVREEDPDRLVTYANFPTAEYLPLPGLDFLTFNIFLERRAELRSYLTRLHNLAGDRPLVVGEIGLHAGDGPAGEQRQADFLDWQLETVVERGVAGACLFSWTDEWWVGDAAVEGWRFGLTREDRTPRPALEVARRWNDLTVADLDNEWPSISVVVCAYNEEATLDECLRHTCALDYPGLEIIVVDDGSTDRTAEIARAHPRVRFVSIDHAGLSVARNAGLRAATGAIVAYLDADAYPSPQWPYYLALAFDRRDVGGAGGPNVPPPDDPFGAQVVAQSPGGPVHVLVTDDRAEHVPGCNMAFWKEVLEGVGGFDPIYTSAGDDVDACWKVLDDRWAIGFHPAALVWHHRRPGLRRYLRQQRGYGRAEALVEARHPDRFSPIGTARWKGRIYDSLVPVTGRPRVYHGPYGSAAYQSVYQGGGHGLDLAHQVGVPLAAAAAVTAPAAAVTPVLGLPAVAAVLFVLALGVIDAVQARPPRHLASRALAFRLGVAVHHLLQPLVRTWGRMRHAGGARRELPGRIRLPGPSIFLPGGVVLLPEDRPRPDLVTAVVALLRRHGVRTDPPTGWEDRDARFPLSLLTAGDLLSSSHPEGSVQLRIRLAARPSRLVAAAVAMVLAAAVSPTLVAAVVVAAGADVARGRWRAGIQLPDLIGRAAG